MTIKNYKIEIRGNNYDNFYNFMESLKDKTEYLKHIEEELGHEEYLVGHFNGSTFEIKFFNDDLSAKIIGNMESIIKSRSKLMDILEVKLNEIK